MAPHTKLTWSVVIPVKLLAHAKSRLAGLPSPDRQALVLAMAADTVAAAISCPLVEVVAVVTDDPAVGAEVRALGAEVIPDRGRAGLNRALITGAEHAARARPGCGRAALTADLPALSGQDLRTALTAATAAPNAFVPDAAGTGTTLYTARPEARFEPLFGPMSRQRHGQSGAVELSLPPDSGLRRDVDTLADLDTATVIGLGRRTVAWRVLNRGGTQSLDVDDRAGQRAGDARDGLDPGHD